MSAQTYKDIARNGIWKQNTSLVQLLGLCPLLAVSTTFVNGVSLAIATILWPWPAWWPACGSSPQIRIPVFILIIAALVTMVDLRTPGCTNSTLLGIFIIVVNCIALARVEAFAAKNTPLIAAWDGAMMGVGMVVAIAVLGGLRGRSAAAVFSGIEMVIPGTRALQLLPENYPGFLVAILPPGAFLVLGFMIAGRNWLDARAAERSRPAAAARAAA
jgi:electron transport complex protein RnfE